MHTSRVHHETVLDMDLKFQQQYNRSTVFHHYRTILVRNYDENFILTFSDQLLKFGFILVSGSTSPTARRLDYPYSYDSASKFSSYENNFSDEKDTVWENLCQILFVYFYSWNLQLDFRWLKKNTVNWMFHQLKWPYHRRIRFNNAICRLYHIRRSHNFGISFTCKGFICLETISKIKN